MALTRWQPFREMQEIQRDMNRLFDDLMVPSSGRNGIDGTFTPAAEFEETQDSYRLRLEIPGIHLDDVDIEVTADAVSISGERKTETTEERQGATRTEFRYGRFQRVIPLPGRINNQNVAAEYKDGILHLTLPKAEEEKNKVVRVKVR